MKRLFLLLTILSFSAYVADAQWRKVEKLKKDKQPNIKIAYQGRTPEPGYRIGAEFILKKKKVTYGKFTRINERFLSANLMYAYNADLYNIFTLHPEYTTRTTHAKSGIFADLNFGFGGGGTFNNDQAPVYILNPDGSESIKPIKRYFIMASIGAGLGYDFNYRLKKPIKLYYRLGLSPVYFEAFPYQALPRHELGIITNLSWLKKN
ncbi:MAG: hypothetical protein RL660_2293 [Bacteroidota bacterium]|jgi:hypothetical protein